MKAKINLATKRIVQVKKLRKFFLSSVIFFGISTGATLFLLLVNFFTNLQISNLLEKKTTLEADVGRYKSVRDALLGTQERLGQIRSVLSERQDAGSKISSTLEVIPSTVTVKSIQYDENEISVAVSSSSLIALQDLIEKELPQLQSSGKKYIGSVAVGDFRVDSENLEYLSSFTVSQVSNVKNSVKKEINKDE